MAGAWDASHAPSRLWRSGAWSIELRDDEIADIRFDGRRVLRSIRTVVRDRDWATAELVVDRVRETEATLTLHVHSVGLGSSFAGVVRVEDRAHALRVFCDLESAAEFQTNRTGLVALHPMQVAGEELHVTHSDGSVEQSAFPEAISPHQPVFDVAGLAWKDDGLAIDLRFSGDVFEMEDQRNWSDASFKTYSRPLGLPFPYALAPGERVRQQIEIRVDEAGSAGTDASDTPVSLRRGGAFPEFLLGAATAPDPGPPAAEITRGIVVELDLGSSNWRAALARARAGGLALDVRATLPRENAGARLGELVEALRGATLLRIAAFDPLSHVTDAASAAALRSAVANAGLDVPIIGGARSHFTEYNREHGRIPADLDGVAIATTPLFHSLGTEQLVESLGAQRLIAQQSVAMADGAPVHFGPVTLRPRFNNVATAPEPGPTRDDLAEGYGAEFTGSADARQAAPELAAWTVASAAALAVPGVASLAWFEEWGPRGIRSESGDQLPVAEAILALTRLGDAPGELLWGDSPDGLVWAIGIARSDGGGNEVLVANLDIRPREVTVLVDASAESLEVGARAFAQLIIPTR